MKNLKKMLAVVTAISAMAVSVPAFAAVTATGPVTDAHGVVTIDYTDVAQNMVRATVNHTNVVQGTDTTIVIFDNDMTDARILAGDFDGNDILYMDQAEIGSSNHTFNGGINLKLVNGAANDATELVADQSYPIRVFYYYDDNGTPTPAIAAATMVVGNGETTIQILWGDVNQDNKFNSNDAAKIFNGLTGGSMTCGEYTLNEVRNGILWGDVNQDNKFNSNDAAKIFNGLTGGSMTCGEYTLNEIVEIVVSAQ